MSFLKRRDMLARAMAAGLVPFLLPGTARSRDSGGDLGVITWDGYQDPAFHGDYIERHGVSPSFEILGDDRETLSKLRAGYAADIAQPCAFNVGAWVDAGVLRPMDDSRLEHWGDLAKSLRRLPRQLNDGRVWFVPVDWGVGSIIYRTDLLPDPDSSWWVLYDDTLAGRIGMQRSADAALGCAALATGVSDPWNMSDDERAVVLRLVEKQNAIIGRYWYDPIEAESGLQNGDLVACYGWNDMYARLQAADVPVGFMCPREGYLCWVCGLSLLASGHQDDAMAYDFINAMTSPKAGAAVISNLGYGHANLKSFDLVSAAVLDMLALSDPDAILENSEFIDQTLIRERDDYAQLFLEAIDAL
ncbi:MAG: hypothetical protein CMM46_13320 [Rhodospirillaceae bacterium]|nr:hypothetical protein [Rhodospirillaceae bacterium]|tara:strand:+ start:2052 stop:3131 length:1080 start_codon:yes stop_codon:yes gene_type:complete